ncbi:MAG: hypothetical protein Q9195_008777 [Heterodermia aff. obscurata]
MPSDMRDDAIGETSVPHNGNIKSPMMIAMKSRFHWALQMRRWRKIPPKDDELQRFEKTINDLQFSIPDIEQNGGPRAYVSLQIDRAVCSSPRQILRGRKAIRNIGCDHQLINGCPIQNLSEAIEKANAHFRTGTVPVEHGSGVRAPSKAGQMPPVPMGIADYEEWDGFFDQFLETDMIE